MATIIGYARVSTTAQDEALQMDALHAAGAARVFVDHVTGTTRDRPALADALNFLRPGDVLVVWRLDRLGRSLRDLIDQVAALGEQGVEFRSLTEGIDTTTPSGRLMFHVMGALAEFERDLIVERTKAGLAAARARGRKGGRPRIMSTQRITTARQMHEAGQSYQAIADTLGVSRATVVRALSASG